jgi:hypothetical protein
MIRGTLKFLVVAAAIACGTALAQTAPRFPIDPEKRLLEQIDLLRRDDGVTAEELIEPLRALALQYQEAGDHALAVVALQEARQVMRANYGLSSASVDDALVLHQEILSEKALGHHERVWTLQQDLLPIARQHLDDSRMLPVFLEIVDDRKEVLNEYSTTDFVKLPAGVFVPCVPGPEGIRGGRVVALDARNCPFGTRRIVLYRLDMEIRTAYAEAIEVLLRNRDYASEELRKLERQALGLVPFGAYFGCSTGSIDRFLEAELVGSCMDPVIAGVGGWTSLMRLAYYEVRSGAPAAARANAFAQLGDWYLQIASADPRRYLDTEADDLARSLYERASAELKQASESMAPIFSPDLPVTLPAYLPNPLASTTSPRHIDVAFTITRYGEPERIAIVDRSENTTRMEEAEVLRAIKHASFRPRAVGGELADAAPVVVRYYLSATPPSYANPPTSPVSMR